MKNHKYINIEAILKILGRLINMIKKDQVLIFIAIFIIITTSCSPDQTTVPTATRSQDSSTSTTTTHSPTQTVAPYPTSTGKPPISGDGTSFLLQTDFAAYQIINFPQNTLSPFSPPGEARHYNLNANLSPIRSLLAFPQNADNIPVMTLENGQVKVFNPLENQEPVFDIESAQEAAQQILTELEFPGEITRESIQDAYDQSTSTFQWFQNDATWLIAAAVEDDRTNLHTYDLETGELTQLETAPGLVQSIASGPTGEFILLKKGFLFDQSTWEDDLYYLISLDESNTQLVKLPEDCDLPQISWFDAENIGIIHQAKLVGGINFSLFNIETGEMTQVVSGEFTELSNFNENLLVLSPASSDNSTRVSLYLPDGEIFQSIDSLCTINHVFESHVILNCELDSFILDENLRMTRFDDPIFLISPAPSGDQIISVVRTGEIKLLDSSLKTEKSLTLAEPPLEIRWRPDSSGFLYRGRGKIYWYDLSTESSDLLIESDLFNDYTNMNGIWIGGN